MTNNYNDESAFYQTEEPTYKDGRWVASITLKHKRKTFYGETPKNVQEQVLHYLDQQVREIERIRALLRKPLEGPHEQ